MTIEKIFSELNTDEKIYSVLMNEDEITLFSDFLEKYYSWFSKPNPEFKVDSTGQGLIDFDNPNRPARLAKFNPFTRSVAAARTNLRKTEGSVLKNTGTALLNGLSKISKPAHPVVRALTGTAGLNNFKEAIKTPAKPLNMVGQAMENRGTAFKRAVNVAGGHKGTTYADLFRKGYNIK